MDADFGIISTRGCLGGPKIQKHRSVGAIGRRGTYLATHGAAALESAGLPRLPSELTTAAPTPNAPLSRSRSTLAIEEVKKSTALARSPADFNSPALAPKTIPFSKDQISKGRSRSTHKMEEVNMGRTLSSFTDELMQKEQMAKITEKMTKINEGKTRLVLVSDDVPFPEILMRAFTDEVVIVPMQSAIWDIETLVSNIVMRAGLPNQQYMSVGIVDHGQAGEFRFLEHINDGVVNMSSFVKQEGRQLVQFFRWLATYVVKPKESEQWRQSSDSRIDLMCCSVTSSQAGLELIHFLENLTGVNWCASSRLVGGSHESDEGFNWVLDTDKHIGSVASHYFDVAMVEKWGQTLVGDININIDFSNFFRGWRW